MNFPEGARGTWNMLSYRKGRKPFKRPLEPSWKSTHWSKYSDVRTKSQRTETYPDIVKCYQNSQNKDHFHRTLEKQLTISETNKIKGKNQTFILPLPQHNQIVVGRRFPLTKEFQLINEDAMPEYGQGSTQMKWQVRYWVSTFSNTAQGEIISH